MLLVFDTFCNDITTSPLQGSLQLSPPSCICFKVFCAATDMWVKVGDVCRLDLYLLAHGASSASRFSSYNYFNKILKNILYFYNNNYYIIIIIIVVSSL